MMTPLDPASPIVDATGRMEQPTQRFFEDLARLPILVGTGSPEGVVEAQVTRLYMDDSGSAGSILYIKKLSDIGGDRSQGWILV